MDMGSSILAELDLFRRIAMHGKLQMVLLAVDFLCFINVTTKNVCAQTIYFLEPKETT